MTLRSAALALSLALPLTLAGGCVKKVYTDAEVATLGALDDVMHAQADLARPAMSKAGAAAFTDEDWTSFAAAASRVKVAASRTKTWSKGPAFDAFADQLGGSADDLAAAVASKDGEKAKAALGAMSASCKGCHSKFN